MEKLMERFELLKKRIFDEDFLYRNRTIIPYFLFVYDPDKEHWINDKIEGLMNSTKEKGNVFQTVNLFDVFLNIFEDDVEDLIEIEKEEGIEVLLEAVGPTLDDNIVDCFTSLTEDAEVVLLNGIGTAYPYIHVSGMLKRLSTSGYMKPIIVFYPGTFNGMELSLFNKSNIIEDEYQIYVIA
jgi:hypothetical protein